MIFINYSNKFFRSFISFLLVFCIISVFVVSPVFAADINDDNTMVDVLSMQQDLNVYFYPNSSTYTVSYPFDYPIYYVDCIVVSDAWIEEVLCNGTYLTIDFLGDWYYRVHGPIYYFLDTISLKFTCSSTISMLYISSLRASIDKIYSDPLPFTIHLQNDGLNNHLISSDVAAGERYYLSSAYDPYYSRSLFGFEYTIYVPASVWHKYDKLNLRFVLYSTSINSCLCTLEDSIVASDFSYSSLTFTDPDSKMNTDFTTTSVPKSHYGITVDLSGVDRNSYTALSIQVSGTYPGHESLSNFGYIYSFTGVSNIATIDVDVTWYRRLYNGLQQWFSNIQNRLDSLIEGSDDHKESADAFNDSVVDQSNELEDLTTDLNSVTRPPISDVNLSTDNMVDQSSIILATSGISSVMGNQIILRVLVLSLTFALAGFILFGKR